MRKERTGECTRKIYASNRKVGARREAAREGSNKLGHIDGWRDEYGKERQQINTEVGSTAGGGLKNRGRKREN
jgi:hypothetical protein